MGGWSLSHRGWWTATGTQASPPELPTLKQNAADASEHSTQYATKPDGQEVNPTLLGRQLLRKAQNRCHAATTFPAPLASLHNLGLRESFLSHTTAFHPHYAHTQAFRERVNLDEHMPDHSLHFQHHRVEHVSQEDGSVCLVFTCDDYKYRSRHLKCYSPHLLSATHHKVKLTPTTGCVLEERPFLFCLLPLIPLAASESIFC